MDTSDTIVAISSTVGGARIVVRMSGPHAIRIAREMLQPVAGGTCALSRGVHSVRLAIGDWSVPAQLLSFRASGSATGEDVIELHAPGSEVLARVLVESAVKAGARHAQPGEFTARAYFNGKLDLSEAEGVSATIAAGNERQLQASRRLASGELTRRLAPVTDTLAETLALLEAGIDFADEGIAFLPGSELVKRIESLAAELDGLLRTSQRFERLARQPRIVLAGRPNAGKSTLLNVLAGRRRAVVSPESGTTRDALSAEVTLSGGSILLVDVAGIEEAAPAAPDGGKSPPDASAEIARQMQSSAIREIERADGVVLVQDLGDQQPPLELPVVPDLIVRTKCDRYPKVGSALCVSAHTGEGLEELKQALSRIALVAEPAGELTLNARHVTHLAEALEALHRARTALQAGPEFAALELRIALDQVGEVSGAVTPDDVLGRIFATFCIGK